MKTVTITFNGNDTTIETAGFTGSACKADTKELKEALGLTDVEETPTREAFTQADNRQEVRRGR